MQESIAKKQNLDSGRMHRESWKSGDGEEDDIVKGAKGECKGIMTLSWSRGQRRKVDWRSRGEEGAKERGERRGREAKGD